MAGTKNSGKRKPQALKQLNGTLQPCRTNYNIPKVGELTDISPPTDIVLTEGGRKIWMSLSADLTRAGILKISDVQSFAIYCNEFDKYLTLSRFVNENGLVEYNNKGDSKMRPEANMIYKSLTIILQYQSRFGLTPVDRERLTIPKDNEDNDFDSNFGL